MRHRWDLTIPEATEVQRVLSEGVRIAPLPRPPRTVAGLDVSFDKHSPTLYAAAVMMEVRTLRVIDIARAVAPAPFPYVPGYLSFRELPVLVRAIERLRRQPDVYICDGHGIAHPRRLGVASHLGVWLDRPTLGCAKSLLVGEAAEPAIRRGSRRQLKHRGEVVGEAIRTRAGVAPVYVSVGHRITLPEARRLVLRLAPQYRITEPIRAAHKEVNEMRLAAKR